jgi:hypothetical protein
MNEPRVDQLTESQRDALAAELAELEGPKRTAAVHAIKTAREHGDLSENFEYHAAKNGHAFPRVVGYRLHRLCRQARPGITLRVRTCRPFAPRLQVPTGRRRLSWVGRSIDSFLNCSVAPSLRRFVLVRAELSELAGERTLLGKQIVCVCTRG